MKVNVLAYQDEQTLRRYLIDEFGDIESELAAIIAKHETRIQYQSSCSGLWYDSIDAVGDIKAVRVGDRIVTLAKHEQGANERLVEHFIDRAECAANNMEGEDNNGFIRWETRMVCAVETLALIGVRFDPFTGKRSPAAESLPSLAPSILEYDGAFKCGKCGAVWGAISGPKTGPCEHAIGQPSLERELAEAINGLLDGLDSNGDTEVCGLTEEQWQQRKRVARAALAKFDAKEA